MGCLVLMPSTFSLFLLDSSLHLAARSSLSQCRLAHELPVAPCSCKSHMQTSRISINPKVSFPTLLPRLPTGLSIPVRAVIFSPPILPSLLSSFSILQPNSPFLSKPTLRFPGYKKHLFISLPCLNFDILFFPNIHSLKLACSLRIISKLTHTCVAFYSNCMVNSWAKAFASFVFSLSLEQKLECIGGT